MYFGPVIPGTRQSRKRQLGAAPAVFNFEKSFGDINVGSPILAHGPQLDEMGLGTDVAHGIEQVKGAGDVVGLHKNRMVHVDHRIGSRWAFAKVNDAIGLKLTEDIRDKVIVAKIALPELQRCPVPFAKRLEPLLHRADRSGAPGTHLLHPVSTKHNVRPGHNVPTSYQVLRQGPPQIAIHTGDEDSHSAKPPFVSESCGRNSWSWRLGVTRSNQSDRKSIS